MSIVNYRKYKEHVTFWVDGDRPKHYVYEATKYNVDEDFVRAVCLGAALFGHSVDEVKEVE